MPLFGDDGSTYQDTSQLIQDRSQGINTMITDVATKRNMDPNFLKTVVDIESGFDPYSNMGNPKRQYKGLGQINQEDFIAHGGEGKNIYDPRANLEATADFLNERKGWFEKEYGREPTRGEWYMLHNQGPGFFTKGTLTNPGGNPYPGMQGTQTKESFLQGWSDRVERGYARFSGGQVPRINVSKPYNPYPKYEDATIDQNHHVPLGAGGLMDDNGRVYGSAIDSRINTNFSLDLGDGKGPFNIDAARFVHLHEMAEVYDMEHNLLPNGMKSSDAYTQAHNAVATPSEQAAVENFAREQGRDPGRVWSAYQAEWKNNIAKTEVVEPKNVHPDLYLHPYDGHKFQDTMEDLTGRSIDNHPSDVGIKGQQVAGLWDQLGNLFGGGDTSPKMMQGVGPMKNYPTSQDLAGASRAQISYGTGREAFDLGQQANIIGYGDTKTEKTLKGYKQTKEFNPMNTAELLAGMVGKPYEAHSELYGIPPGSQLQRQIGDLFTAAEIAVNHNAVAALGYDPVLSKLDVVMKAPNVAGMYGAPSLGGNDAIWATTFEPSTIVHESIHRGIEILKSINPEARKLMNRLPSEELVVRYMMYKYAGDPEPEGDMQNPAVRRVIARGEKPAGIAQHDEAVSLIGGDALYKGYVEQLHKLASDEIAKRHPPGGHQ